MFGTKKIGNFEISLKFFIFSFLFIRQNRSGPAGNDVQKTNVPDLRTRFRHETYLEEMNLCLKGGSAFQTRMYVTRRNLEKC